ncbi:MAG: site-2 protease family protein [Planctomycetes bacterium]|nr:site-2 protease family protein [Planctomycetota bacterium]
METIQDFLKSIYREYQVVFFRGGRVVRGRIRAMTDAGLADLKQRLHTIGWPHRFEEIEGVDYLNCMVVDKPLRRRYALHLGLFIATVITTLLAGGGLELLDSHQVISRILANLALAAWSFFSGASERAAQQLSQAGGGFLALLEIMRSGIPFSAAILTILGCHEMGHYLMARRHGMNVTLPFFIPVPVGIGTLGAVIRIKSPLMHRRSVLDIGAAGPLAGAVVAMIFLTVGLRMSEMTPMSDLDPPILFGESLLMKSMIWLLHGNLPPGHALVYHSFAFAGWLGLLITAINLMPIGQLDGGHVAYALFGRFQRRLASMAFGLLVMFGLLGLTGEVGLTQWHGAGKAYLPWLLCAAFMRSFMKPAHPPALDESVRLNTGRVLVGALCLALLVLCFIPAPMTFISTEGAV